MDERNEAEIARMKEQLCKGVILRLKEIYRIQERVDKLARTASIYSDIFLIFIFLVKIYYDCYSESPIDVKAMIFCIMLVIIVSIRRKN